MPKTYFNVIKANAEISANHTALDAALTAANVLTVKVDGKDVPLAEASAVAKVEALNSLVKHGDANADLAELTQSNSVIAERAEKAESDLAIEKAKNDALSREKVSLVEKAQDSANTVASLTAKNTDLTTQLEASNKEGVRLTKELTAQNQALSEVCIAAGVIDFASLGEKATAEQKLEFANKIPFADKLKMYRGAVNATIAKTGAAPLELPAAPPAGGSKAKDEKKGLDRMAAATKIAG